MTKQTNKTNQDTIKPDDSSNIDPSIDNIQEPVKIKLEGKILSLCSNSTVWRSSTGRIDLSRFSGIISAHIPDDITEFETVEIIRGLDANRIEITEKITDASPITINTVDLSLLHSVNNFLDEKKITIFEQNVKRTASRSFLSICLSTEENDRNREAYKTIIKDKLNSIS